MTTCPKCGRIITYRNNFCPSCGTQLNAKCPNCGRTIWIDDAYCGDCGAKNPLT